MKKNLFGTCLMASMMFVACSTDSNEPKEVDQEASKTTFTVTTEGNSVTKVMWNSYNDKSWEITDQIEAYDQNGNRLVFDATSVNGNSASFSATGTLNAGPLAVFYPPTAESGYNYTIDATGQTQVGNNTVAHLKDKTYLLGHTTLEAGSNSFSVTMNQILAELKWTLNLPASVSPDSVAAVAMKAGSADAFKSSMVYTVVDGVASETGYTPTDEVSVAMTNMTGASSPVVAHMLASPTILSNEDLEVLTKNANGAVNAYKVYTGVNVTYANGEIYSGTISDMTSTPTFSNWDTSNYGSIYTDGQTVQSVTSDDGASTIEYIKHTNGNPLDFFVITSGDDAPYLKADKMSSTNAFVLEVPVYKQASSYVVHFEIKNPVQQGASTSDISLKLQHANAAQKDANNWTEVNMTYWKEYAPGDINTILADGTDNNLTINHAETFEHIYAKFDLGAAEYDKEILYLAIDRTDGGNDEMDFKLLSIQAIP